jgi:hypothetical protein
MGRFELNEAGFIDATLRDTAKSRPDDGGRRRPVP